MIRFSFDLLTGASLSVVLVMAVAGEITAQQWPTVAAGLAGNASLGVLARVAKRLKRTPQ